MPDHDTFETDYQAALDLLKARGHKVEQPYFESSTGDRRCRIDGLALDDDTIIRKAHGDTEYTERVLRGRDEKENPSTQN